MTPCHLTPSELEAIHNNTLDEPFSPHGITPQNSDPNNLNPLNSKSHAPSNVSDQPQVMTNSRSSSNDDSTEVKGDSTSEADDVEDARNSTLNLLAENEEEEEDGGGDDGNDDTRWKRNGGSPDDDVEAERGTVAKESSGMKLLDSQTDPDSKVNNNNNNDDGDDGKGKHKKSNFNKSQHDF